jgi:hypothetical protein
MPHYRPLAAAIATVIAATLTACNSNHSHSEAQPHNHETHHHHAAGAQRLLIDDGAGTLHLYDLADDKLVNEPTAFPLADVSALYRSEDGRFAIIRVRGAEADHGFRFLDSGVVAEAHGDHFHLEIEDPALLDYAILGVNHGTAASAHAVSLHNQITLFFDGTTTADAAQAVTLPLSNLTAATPINPTVISGNRHHGVALPTRSGDILTSVAETSGSTARTGAKVFSTSPNITEVGNFAHDCAGLHGYAVIGDNHLFGCARDTEGSGHILNLRYQPDATPAWSKQTIAYPSGDQRVSNFAFHRDLKVAFAPWGSEAMLRIDPISGSSVPLNLSSKQCGYALREDNGSQLLLLRDGGLDAYSTTTLAKVATREIVGFTCPTTNPQPQLASVGGYAYLTLPTDKRVMVIELEEDGMDIKHSLELSYTPTRMVPFYHPAGVEDYPH